MHRSLDGLSFGRFVELRAGCLEAARAHLQAFVEFGSTTGVASGLIALRSWVSTPLTSGLPAGF